MLANPAHANILDSATATVDCNGFNVTVLASGLIPGTTYEIDFTLTLTPTSGPAIPVTGKIDFVAGSSSVSEGASGTWPGAPLTQPYTVTGTATLASNGSTVPITFNGADSIDLSCTAATGCPATIGFWKNHIFPPSVVSGGLVIGGVQYSATDLLTILNENGGNAIAILGRQLVGARINIAAGAVDNPTADGAIATAEALLKANSLNLLTSDVDPSSTLGQALIAQSVILDAYNSGNFNTCAEGTGLTNGGHR